MRCLQQKRYRHSNGPLNFDLEDLNQRSQILVRWGQWDLDTRATMRFLQQKRCRDSNRPLNVDFLISTRDHKSLFGGTRITERLVCSRIMQAQ